MYLAQVKVRRLDTLFDEAQWEPQPHAVPYYLGCLRHHNSHSMNIWYYLILSDAIWYYLVLSEHLYVGVDTRIAFFLLLWASSCALRFGYFFDDAEYISVLPSIGNVRIMHGLPLKSWLVISFGILLCLTLIYLSKTLEGLEYEKQHQEADKTHFILVFSLHFEMKWSPRLSWKISDQVIWYEKVSNKLCQSDSNLFPCTWPLFIRFRHQAIVTQAPSKLRNLLQVFASSD